jgi:hypothetical protein
VASAPRIARNARTFFPGFFPENQEKVSTVDKKAASLAHDEHRVSSQDRVYQQEPASAHAEIPESDGNDAFALSFAHDPLDEKSSEKKPLGRKTQNQHVIVHAPSREMVHTERIDSRHLHASVERDNKKIPENRLLRRKGGPDRAGRRRPPFRKGLLRDGGLLWIERAGLKRVNLDGAKNQWPDGKG